MRRPDVSVLMPSYNHEDYVEEAVASALAFDGDLEVVIVDDGSTDSSPEILRRLDSDDRVTVVEQENRGAHAALNRCLERAAGEYIFILDSDDVFPENRIGRMIQALDEHRDASIAASWIRIIDEKGNELGIKEGWRTLPPWPAPSAGPFLSDLGDPTLAMLETNFVSTTSNLALRRSSITDSNLRFLGLRYTHDWEFILSACRFGSLHLLPEPLVDYRVHSSNTIKEGADLSVGPMRFEILWTVARHAHSILQSASKADRDMDDLIALAWNSMPTFGCDGILDRLLVLRGTSAVPPPAFDALLDPGHDFHRSAVEALAAAGD